jgi:hypothetical protein
VFIHYFLEARLGKALAKTKGQPWQLWIGMLIGIAP